MTVDVVVRDKAGQPVLGLTENDFEVLEDGVPQRIISVDARSRPIPHRGSNRSTDAEPLVPRADPAQAIVALVFHQLSHESRAAAIAAARSMVESTARNEYVGVVAEHPFGLGRAIVVPHLSERIDRTGRDSLLVAIPLVAPRRVAGQLALVGATVPPAQVPVSFDAPAQDGSVIRFVELPIRHLPPGPYTLTLTIDGLAKPLVRRATFVLPPLPKSLGQR